MKDKTLEQLIEECGVYFHYLTRSSGQFTGDKLWFHEGWEEGKQIKPIFGATPREVVEKLWTKLHDTV